MTRPIRSDSRYTIGQEFTGHASGKPQFVIRFCGEWIDSRSSYSAAVLRATGHRIARDASLIVQEIPA